MFKRSRGCNSALSKGSKAFRGFRVAEAGAERVRHNLQTTTNKTDSLVVQSISADFSAFSRNMKIAQSMKKPCIPKKKRSISISRRFTHKKRMGRTPKAKVSPEPSQQQSERAGEDQAQNDMVVSDQHESEGQVHLCFHDYAKPYPKVEALESVEIETNPYPKVEALESIEIETSFFEAPDQSVLEDAKKRIDLRLPRYWVSLLEEDGLSCILFSRARPRVTQRNVFFHYSGSVEINVHCQLVSADNYVDHMPSVPLQAHLINEFVDRAVSVISRIRLMEVCMGVDSKEYTGFWNNTPGGIIDRNPYNEARYSETLRSLSCSLLVQLPKKMCAECAKLVRNIRRRSLHSQKENFNNNTANIYLSEEQMLMKIKNQRKELAAAKGKLKRLHEKIEDLD